MSYDQTITRPLPGIARHSPSPGALPDAAVHSHGWGYLALGLSVLCIGVAMNFIHEAARSMPVLWVVTMLCVAGPPAMLVIGGILRLLGMRGGMASVTPISQLRQFRQHPVALTLASTSGALAAALMVYVNYRNGASTAAFLSNLTILFVVLGGVLQGERLSATAITAIAVVILGAFIYSLTRDVAIVGPALLIMTVSCLGSAIKQCIVARWARKAELASFVAAKQVYMAALLAIVALSANGLAMKLDRGLAYVLAAGVLQSALGMTLLYVGMQSVGLSRAAPTTALRPIVVLIVGLAFGESLPGPMRMAGAMMIVVGAVVLCARRRSSDTRQAPSVLEDAVGEEAIQLQEKTP